MPWWSTIQGYTARIADSTFVHAAVVIVAGWLIGKWLSGGIGRLLTGRVHIQVEMLARRGVFYGTLIFSFIHMLRLIGLDLSVLLGAAGILTVAVGFASQTSASNLISGLFMIGERPFVIGDVIKAGSTMGEVLSIDLLSVKLRTFDNLFVRVPNELLIKSEIVNYTHFPIRRADIVLNVNYKEDLERIRALLTEIARAHPLCLEEPKPQLFFLGFGESAQQIQFSVWGNREQFIDMRNEVQEQIRVAFNAHNIALPFPHRALIAASPIPVELTYKTTETARGPRARRAAAQRSRMRSPCAPPVETEKPET
jgi:small-conductance mechanosensitive channel